MAEERTLPLHTYLALIFVFIVLVYINTYSANNPNVAQATTLNSAANAFNFMLVIPLLLFVLLYLKKIPFSDKIPDIISGSPNALNFGAIGLAFGVVAYSVTKLFFSRAASIYDPTQSVFAQAAVSLDPFFQKFVVTVAAPVVEPFWFRFAIPITVFVVLAYLAKDLKWQFLAENKTKFGIATAVTSLAFAYFHVAQQGNPNFLKFAIAFGVVTMLLIWGDALFNLLPFVQAGLMGEVGYHLANNVEATGGWIAWVTVMQTNPIGWLVLLWLVSAFVITITFYAKKKTLNVQTVTHNVTN